MHVAFDILFGGNSRGQVEKTLQLYLHDPDSFDFNEFFEKGVLIHYSTTSSTTPSCGHFSHCFLF